MRSTSGTGLYAAEHVARLADLVEDLVGGDPHEVRIHELDDRTESTVECEAAREAGECVLADRRAENAVRILVGEALGGTVRTALEPVNVFTHHDDAIILGHAAIHDGCHCIDELDALGGPARADRLERSRVGEL